MEKQVQTKRQIPNKYIYLIFLMGAIIFVCINDLSTALIFGGIGLAFDPFDEAVSFQKRPLWQKIWLIAHCVFVFVVIGFNILR